LPSKLPDPNEASDSDHIRAKTVVTAISRITDRPLGNEACLVVIYGDELGKKYNLNSSSLLIGRSS
jgi:two-component system cell cycle response regulator